MRRMLLSAAGLGLLAIVIGCNHTAGICDCDSTHNMGCDQYGHCAVITSAAPTLAPAPVPVPLPQPKTEMPKADAPKTDLPKAKMQVPDKE